MTELAQFLSCRDLLLTHRTDYDAAVQAFKWPMLEHFNWALDYFDGIARDNPAPALHIVEDSGQQFRLSYAELSQRSNQVANWLVDLGARKGDRILLMMGNEVPLWETMLAAIKLGAVLIPATTLLSGDDLADRLQRGKVRHVITNAAGMAKIIDLPHAVTAGLSLVSVSSAAAALPAGWADYWHSKQASPVFSPPEPTRVTDPLLEYFTSGTTAKPKLVQHTQQSYPVGHLSTLYWLGLKKAMCTGPSAHPVGPSTPGAAFLPRSMPRPACLFTTTRASMARPSWPRWWSTASTPCARHPPSGAC